MTLGAQPRRQATSSHLAGSRATPLQHLGVGDVANKGNVVRLAVCPGSLDEERKRMDAFEARAETEAFGYGVGTAEGAANLPAKRGRYTDDRALSTSRLQSV